MREREWLTPPTPSRSQLPEKTIVAVRGVQSQFFDMTKGLVRGDDTGSGLEVDADATVTTSQVSDTSKKVTWQWTTVNGAVRCEKYPYTPPTGPLCLAVSGATAGRKGTQGGLPVQWFDFSMAPLNGTVAAVCPGGKCVTTINSVLHYSSIEENISDVFYNRIEFEDYSVAPVRTPDTGGDVVANVAYRRRGLSTSNPPSLPPQVPASVFVVPAECPK